MQTEGDRALIAREFEELRQASIKRCANQEEYEMVLRAFEFANEAHKEMRRRSGEPYILHPIAVASIVVKEIGLGYKSIVSALLHDVVEDTEYGIDDIQRLFGSKIASLVDGLTKINIAFDAGKSEQAENFKRILLTLGDDVRVILIKLADRLHNLRTIAFMPEYKRTKILSETMYIFIPLAHRLGLYAIKSEMENIWFSYSLPEEHTLIQEKLSMVTASRSQAINKFVEPLSEILNQLGYPFTLVTRVKTPYSIWRKMQGKNIPFDQIYDIFAIRIVFEPEPKPDERTQCFTIYTAITQKYLSKSDRIRDWTNKPKPNGYEALHCTLMGPEGNWIEVQIRTKRMDEIAERGVAAHWMYKDNVLHESEIDKLIEQVRQVLENPDVNALEFLDRFHTSLLSPDIYLFTPKGATISLPKESTALDFGYAVHSAIGNKAIAAKANHKLVPLNYVLQPGDQIEIITADSQLPQREWLDFVKTPKARTAITEVFKAEVADHLKKGQLILETKLAALGIQPHARVLRKLMDAYKQNNRDALYSQIGADILDLSDLEKVLKQNKPKKNVFYWALGVPQKKDQGDKRYALQENPLEKTLSYRAANCCRPIPGDQVMAFTQQDGEVLIHKSSCPVAIQDAARFGDRIVDAEWQKHVYSSFLVRISIRGIDRLGILNDITQYVTLVLSINIRKVIIETHDGIFEGHIDLYVHHTEEVDR
ncbi:MAG: RelA/SpoT family protein, partial [Bacteroidetes bacterium]|nr:RelA/SpoT family protein [Bacteroidota bacterium]